MQKNKPIIKKVSCHCAKCGRRIDLNVLREVKDKILANKKRIICDSCNSVSKFIPVTAFTKDGFSIVFNEFISESDIKDFNDIAKMVLYGELE